MSHFTVLVIGDNPEEQLEPYWELDLPKEELEEDPRAEYHIDIEAADVPAEVKEDAEGWITFRQQGLDKLRELIAQDKWAEASESIHSLFKDKTLAAQKETVHEKISEYKSSIKKYQRLLEKDDWYGIIKDYTGMEPDDQGNFGYWHNPNAKWDWHMMGGRWYGYFRLKDGATGTHGKKSWGNQEVVTKKNEVDQCRKGDVDWEYIIQTNERNARKEWAEYQNADEKDKQMMAFLNKITKDDTEESYVQRASFPSTFAVVKDGKWYEKGEMGWWAMVSNEKDQADWDDEFRQLVMGLPDDTLLTLFDCHI